MRCVGEPRGVNEAYGRAKGSERGVWGCGAARRGLVLGRGEG